MKMGVSRDLERGICQYNRIIRGDFVGGSHEEKEGKKEEAFSFYVNTDKHKISIYHQFYTSDIFETI